MMKFVFSAKSSAGLLATCCLLGGVSTSMASPVGDPGAPLQLANEMPFAPVAQAAERYAGNFMRGDVYSPVSDGYPGYEAPVDFNRDFVPPPVSPRDSSYQPAQRFIPQTERPSYYRQAPATQQRQISSPMPIPTPAMPPMPGFALPEAFSRTFKLPGFSQAWNMDLADEQRGELRNLQKGLRRINHALSGELMDAVDGIQEVFEEATRDPKRVGKAYEQYFDVQRRWIEAQIAASNRVKEIAEAARRAHEEMEVAVPVPGPVPEAELVETPVVAD